MAVEVEARFSATGPAPLAHLAGMPSLGSATLGPATTFDEIDHYLDTDAGALAAVRWACRLRSRGSTVIVSLKGPPAGDGAGWLHRRPEVEGPASDNLGPDSWPPSEARQRLLELSGGAPLQERFRLLQQRTERSVSIDGRQIGTLSLDEVRVERMQTRAGTFHVVELELLDDESTGRAALHDLAATLGEVPGLAPEPYTKLEHALDLLAPKGQKVSCMPKRGSR